MNVDKSLNVLGDMDDTLSFMLEIVPNVRWSVREMANEWNTINNKDMWDNHQLEMVFDDTVDKLSNLTNNVMVDIRDFDKMLASLISMRAKLSRTLGV